MAPMFEVDWLAEQQMMLTEGPVLDGSGNLYFSPTFPTEEVLFVSLAPDGQRRWVVPGLSNGCGSPIVLEDPDRPGEQIIYVGSYDRALALRPDADSNGNGVIEQGEAVWDVPTGLDKVTYDSSLVATHVFGVNYDPTTDAIIGLAGDGHVYALDRATGASMLKGEFVVPGAPSPSGEIDRVPRWLLERVEAVGMPFFGHRANKSGKNLAKHLLDVLLGNESKVANYFSVDPGTGRIWITATAPDQEDGSVDGVSEFGALYCFKLVPDGSGTYELEKLFHIPFKGGSASTPALNADGSRVYVGDNFGKLIAIDACNGDIIWKLDVGTQIFASASVASDNGEVYLSTGPAVIKVVDRGDFGEEIWRSKLDMYAKRPMKRTVNLLSTSIVANGVVVQVGNALVINDTLPVMPLSLGVALLDRKTGRVRYFTEGGEESVSIIAIGPDGSIYIGHSPIRRAFTNAVLGPLVPDITGGIQKFSPVRNDLLIQDALYAAAARAENVATNGEDFSSDLKQLEARQIMILINQSREVSPRAIAEGVLSTGTWDRIEDKLACAESALASSDFASASNCLNEARALVTGE